MPDLPSLSGKVCLVTGASRGIGKGIALMLGKAGATVYVTGRTLQSATGKPGSLMETAQEVEYAGGKCIPVQCDHGKDEDVKQLFARIKREQGGRLDVLVNNAYKGVQTIFETYGKPFYEQPISLWDDINDVGLRSSYVASWFGAQMMVQAKQGLIVNISSPGGLVYFLNVPYGVGKAATDRMMADMSIELRKNNVAAISLWPGPVSTEAIKDMLKSEKSSQMQRVFADSEDVTFTGKAVAWLAADPDIMKKSGSVQIVAELAREYGFTDVGGVMPLSLRQVKKLVQRAFPSLAWLVPEFLYIPAWLISANTHKFKPPSKLA
ncbi:dehydrogenase/reductase SDR family member 1 [Nematostella vectensis]|uniref:dehydrogenase/reductase SDR family member 1 n=1 Tax=Nematostella vectensis TaxID=45351 RepID=UPI00138FFBA3|nr:dehydrogenase/reductase SDR family member 1 [Nematostella vectensis]XP_032230131.1 dehydrogenase/reductase SDR family member 1 [Nematostella vectensis]XP_032230133.1 dehydrogenase/reductase SDR family member 1 [Nematostella vectensis]